MMVKISDFGLSKSLSKESYYKLDNKNEELPIKWRSVEAIEDGLFSTKSCKSLHYFEMETISLW